MARRLRQHVNPLALHHVGVGPGVIAVPGDRPVEVELGCGDGQFLFERAAAEPGGYYLGVEIRREWVDRIKARGAANVDAVLANLLSGRARFAPRSVRRFFVNFPDPLFKRRQQRRRWLDEKMAGDLCEALVDGGEIFFQSDVFEPALDALAVLEGTPGLDNIAGAWRFAKQNPFGVRSRREAWCQAHGVPIWRLLFRKLG
jgi:tRNA (guanine-N7-)-methyltransferase